MEPVCRHTKNRKPSQKDPFLIGKCFEDARQDEKHVPDLLEAIIQPPDLVKEELWSILLDINQIRPEITKIRVCNFQMSEQIPDSANVAFVAGI